MARYDHAPVFQQMYRLTLDMHRMVGNFKKEHKYTLGEKLKSLCCGILDGIVCANSEREKRATLETIDFRLESLRIHLRLAYDLKAIGAGSLGKVNLQIEEIGRQIGGWKKWSER